ncbi:hypothetical protein HRR83_004048 [Exophiala dermatitidis]|uniref:Asl1-like glycosyl hydrolase catalytic domain-containing protein n=1 Tax=Exophiala dermatitidis TaxID=5970 RepID=A0AAN6ELZ5_EXODE|nr:hypothetical protein HRR73_007691 [Exophiala dermatitidis]KAJ4521649.1 hypothetical protein HRR74_003474 [Exophiala dermatitidis]KAJ4531775.1 hypothetical protein HRR77_009184 [Exophiala dermatitidis]KAJ4545070.1 hypothetical protein HRR76_003100 [Exophiala dermatitidis]KAJ4554692.1 hypothetical protein HRR79_009406 [Exophiala dermatitidis]
MSVLNCLRYLIGFLLIVLRHQTSSLASTTNTNFQKDTCVSVPQGADNPSRSSVASPAPQKTGGLAGGKRGLAYNDASLTYLFANQSSVSWGYNWAPFANGSLPSNLEFIPTLWGLGEDATSSWFTQASSAISYGSKHLFSFNEPDIATQANLTASEAADGFIQYMNPFHDQAELATPSVTNGLGDSLGLEWLSSFFDACAGRCLVDTVNIHWYGSAVDTSAFQAFVSNASALATENGVGTLWITELRGNGGIDQQLQFLETALPWLDSNDDVSGYAWFMCAAGDGNLVSSRGVVSALGQLYG